jgi:hypothetical protein
MQIMGGTINILLEAVGSCASGVLGLSSAGARVVGPLSES